MWCLNLFSAILTSGRTQTPPSHSQTSLCILQDVSYTLPPGALLLPWHLSLYTIILWICEHASRCVSVNVCKCHFSREPTPTAGDIFTGEMSPEPFSSHMFVWVCACECVWLGFGKLQLISQERLVMVQIPEYLPASPSLLLLPLFSVSFSTTAMTTYQQTRQKN